MKSIKKASRTNNNVDNGVSTSDAVSEILVLHFHVVEQLATMMRHPRSLARPVPHWRPQTWKLPGICGEKDLHVSISRQRVGPRAAARVRGFSESHSPAYVISLRFTDPNGVPVTPAISEAWIRALVPAPSINAVHEISQGHAATYVWLVDRDFHPVHSPSSLFSSFIQAA
ncbi:MAG: hypothetical protein SOW59_00620 [Corynebacterium sp.]|nr:hypothetical protein [Corynebacterium sp.]